MKAYLFFFLTILFLSQSNLAQNAFIPEPTGKVVSDFENLLTVDEQEELAAILQKSYQSSSNQLMIVCLPTKFVGDLSIEDYAQQFFKKWQPGQKRLDNGVLLMVTGSKTDNVGRKIRIHVGYGLEGALPDLLCKHIQMQLMVPLLKEDRYADAIRAGSLAILEAIKNENIGQQIKFKSKPKEGIILTDQLGILSATEYAGFENRMTVFYTKSMLPSSIKEGENQYTGVLYASGYLSDYLFELDVNHNVRFTFDSIGNTTLSKDPTLYSLSMNNAAGFSEQEMEENRLRVEALLQKDDVVGAINDVISMKEKGMARGWAEIRMLTGIQIGLLAVAFLFWILHVRKIWTAKTIKGLQKFVIGIINVPILIVSLLALLAIIILHVGLYSHDYNLSTTSLLWVGIVQEVISLVTIFFVGDNLLTFFPGSGKSSGGGYQSAYSYTSSSSNYSSSGSGSSYSGSYSSGSNSDYGGGGGSSGGGGASSDW
ncbi:MAG: TPM domain-containing protein [Bacteroidota bacterium]